MELEVTKNFEKQFSKLDPQMQRSVEAAFEKLAENPKSVNFEEKRGNAKGIFSMRIDGNNRVSFTKNLEGNFVPVFVGNHREYDKFLAQKANKLTPSALLGSDNSRIKTMDLDIPESLRGKSVLGKTSFSIGNIKLHGVVGTVISVSTALALSGGVDEAIASTTPGHVGMELYDGDYKGATEALLVDGAGDVGCIAAGAAGATYLGSGGAVIGGPVGGGAGVLVGGIGGCIVGSIAASETVQAIWDWAFGDDEIAGPKEILDNLKKNGIEQVPDEITPDMPDDLKELVVYKNKVVEALDKLNESAKTLSNDPDNSVARADFIEASSNFSQAADAYQYSVSSMESPEDVMSYIQKTLPDSLVTFEIDKTIDSSNSAYHNGSNSINISP